MKYKCKICGEVFNAENEVRKHIRSNHLGDLEYSMFEKIGE